MFGNKKRNNAQKEKPLGRYTLKHITGLPIPSTTCSVIVYDERICFTLGSTDLELSIDKLTAINFELNVDIDRYLKSSIARGIAGAAIFGTTGAVIGSSPSSKVKRNVSTCAILCYQSANGTTEYIVLEDAVPNTKEAARFVDKVRPLIRQCCMRNKIQL